jgi:hypothetical protein
VREQEAARCLRAESPSQRAQRQRRRVRGDDRAGSRHGRHPGEQRPLDLEVLDDGLNDPFGLGEAAEMVLDVPRCDKCRGRAVHEGGRVAPLQPL